MNINARTIENKNFAIFTDLNMKIKNKLYIYPLFKCQYNDKRIIKRPEVIGLTSFDIFQNMLLTEGNRNKVN